MNCAANRLLIGLGGLSFSVALILVDRVIAGIVQCSSMGSCPW